MHYKTVGSELSCRPYQSSFCIQMTQCFLLFYPVFQDGMTPLMYAAREGNLEVIKTLVLNGHADVNLKESVSSSIAN